MHKYGIASHAKPDRLIRQVTVFVTLCSALVSGQVKQEKLGSKARILLGWV